MEIVKIRKILKSKISPEAKKGWVRFVPSGDKILGVRVPKLNEIIKEIKEPDFKLAEELWKSGILEEKIMAAKILGKICEKNPKKTLRLAEKFSKDISDWAVCDTLGTQGIKKIAQTEQKNIFKLSRKLVLSKNIWQRRFGLVLLVNFAKDKNLKKDIQKIIKRIENDKEYYVKKAVIWLKKEIKKIDK